MNPTVAISSAIPCSLLNFADFLFEKHFLYASVKYRYECGDMCSYSRSIEGKGREFGKRTFDLGCRAHVDVGI